jgi:porphobilinogen synthase
VDPASPVGEEIVDNAAACKRLADAALAYAKAGAHMVCPSDMMDGRIGAIKELLVANGFEHVSIMSYTSKKASCMYAPFRAAVDSTFTGDRKRYQQPVGASKIAGRALKRDLAEGADFVLVKPALFYGDIISEFSQNADVPVAVYIVSGEYKMLTDYGTNTGTMEAVVKESHVGMLRSGASILITYFTPMILDWIPGW